MAYNIKYFEKSLNASLIKKKKNIILHFVIVVYLKEQHSFILVSIINLKLIFVIMFDVEDINLTLNYYQINI